MPRPLFRHVNAAKLDFSSRSNHEKITFGLLLIWYDLMNVRLIILRDPSTCDHQIMLGSIGSNGIGRAIAICIPRYWV